MKTFGEYFKKRIYEDQNTMGLKPPDTGIRPKEDHPMDHDQEAQLSRLVQLTKTAVHKYPEMMMSLLEKIAEKDGEIRAGLEAIKNDTLNKGSKAFRDKGLGHMGHEDGMDHVMPNVADSNTGTGNDE